MFSCSRQESHDDVEMFRPGNTFRTAQEFVPGENYIIKTSGDTASSVSPFQKNRHKDN